MKLVMSSKCNNRIITRQVCIVPNFRHRKCAAGLSEDCAGSCFSSIIHFTFQQPIYSLFIINANKVGSFFLERDYKLTINQLISKHIHVPNDYETVKSHTRNVMSCEM
jgi:uncharacterized protein (DUF1919 family)